MEILRDRLFNEENMYARMERFASEEKLEETRRALLYMRERHLGQFRKKGKHTHKKIDYINHPLMMACHAHALGICDDALLTGVLLHDVVEDTGVSASELPFSEEVQQLVSLVSYSIPEGMTYWEAKAAYYGKIRLNAKACVIKCLDRCNNISTMAGSFQNQRMQEYITETEEYIFPLLTELKINYPEYSNLAFVLKYHMLSVLETIKNMLLDEAEALNMEH